MGSEEESVGSGAAAPLCRQKSALSSGDDEKEADEEDLAPSFFLSSPTKRNLQAMCKSSYNIQDSRSPEPLLAKQGSESSRSEC